MDKFIRNIDHESVVRLAELVSVQSEQVGSKTLAQNKAVSMTRARRSARTTPPATQW